MAGIFECALIEALNGQDERAEARKAAAICWVKCFGTADGWPNADRNHASFLYRFGTTHILIDCGEGPAAAIRRAV